MTTTANQLQAPAARELTQAQATRAALLPLLVDVAVPLGGYYLLQHFGVGMVASLALSGLLPAVRTVYSVVHDRRTEPLAMFTLVVTAISIPITFITGSARFMLAKESIGTGPLAVWLIVSALVARPVMASAFRAFLARTPKAALAWEDLTANSAAFRHCLNMATLVWGVGFLVEFVVRLLVVFELPIRTAVWATNLPMIGAVLVCVVVAGRWLGPAEKMIREHA